MSSPRRAYVVGTNFSGSTVFGQALGAHSAVTYLGEMDRLNRFEPTAWIDQPEPSCHYCELNGRTCPVWTPARRTAAREVLPGQLMDLVEHEFGTGVFVDGSKHPSWLRAVLAEERADRDRVVAFLTVRSPFAFADSFRFRTGCQAWEAGNVWRDVYTDAVRTINRVGLPCQVVRYEQFAREPEQVLRAAASLLGVDFEPDMLDFQSRPRHDLGGNPNVLAVPEQTTKEFSVDSFRNRIPASWHAGMSQPYWGRRFGGWVDEKWHANLSEGDVEQVLQTPGLVDVAVSLGYELSRELAGWSSAVRERAAADA